MALAASLTVLVLIVVFLSMFLWEQHRKKGELQRLPNGPAGIQRSCAEMEQDDRHETEQEVDTAYPAHVARAGEHRKRGGNNVVARNVGQVLVNLQLSLTKSLDLPVVVDLVHQQRTVRHQPEGEE